MYVICKYNLFAFSFGRVQKRLVSHITRQPDALPFNIMTFMLNFYQIEIS